MPWRLPINRDNPTEPLSEEGIQAIHETAMRILEEIGVAFLNDEARATSNWPVALLMMMWCGWTATLSWKWYSEHLHGGP